MLGTATRATDDVPTHTAGTGATTAGARGRSRGLGHINEGTGSRARLEGDIRNASHFRVRTRRAHRARLALCRRPGARRVPAPGRGWGHRLLPARRAHG